MQPLRILKSQQVNKNIFYSLFTSYTQFITRLRVLKYEVSSKLLLPP